MAHDCYLCEEVPPNDGWSLEHIIPNALGGRWTSDRLLCRACNSTLGHAIDAVLCHELRMPMNMLDLTRDRGDVPNEVVTLPDGNEYIRGADGNLRLRRTVIEEKRDGDLVTVSIRGRDKRDARKHLSALARKYPGKVNVADFLASATEQVQPLRSPTTFHNRGLGSDEALRAIAKIAVGAFLARGGHRHHVADCIRYVVGQDVGRRVRWHYSVDVLYPRGPMEITHVVAIRGSTETRQLWAYVELFRMYRFAVLLNSEYAGRAVAEDYVYELTTEKELRDVHPAFSFAAIRIGDGTIDDETIEGVKRAGDEVARIASRRSVEMAIATAVDGAFAEALAVDPNATAEQMVPLLQTKLLPIIISLLPARGGNDRDGSR